MHSFHKRFPIIIMAYVILMTAYLYYADQKGSIEFIEIGLFGFPILWVWIEHDLLEYKKVFYKLLGFISILVIIAIYLSTVKIEDDFPFYTFGAFTSLSLLVAMMTLKRLFLQVFDHEAHFLDDSISRSFKLHTIDFFYSLLVMALTAVLAWSCFALLEQYVR